MLMDRACKSTEVPKPNVGEQGREDEENEDEENEDEDDEEDKEEDNDADVRVRLRDRGLFDAKNSSRLSPTSLVDMLRFLGLPPYRAAALSPKLEYDRCRASSSTRPPPPPPLLHRFR